MLRRLEELESKLKNKYKNITINDRNCFLTKDGTIFHLTALIPFNSIVIEYAGSMEEAAKNLFEDGDLFDMDEMDLEQMYESMIKEIDD